MDSHHHGCKSPTGNAVGGAFRQQVRAKLPPRTSARVCVPLVVSPSLRLQRPDKRGLGAVACKQEL